MIVAQIAGLAHAHRIKEPVFVGAIVSHLVPSVFPIAGRAHVFGVVLSVDVGAFRYLHNLLWLVRHDIGQRITRWLFLSFLN